MMKKKPKTTLKLWEKSFLLTFCVFFILLNIAFGIWSVYQFKSALAKEMELCRTEAQQLTARIDADGCKSPFRAGDGALDCIFTATDRRTVKIVV